MEKTIAIGKEFSLGGYGGVGREPCSQYQTVHLKLILCGPVPFSLLFSFI